jgi:hypothetical protein
MLDRSGRVKAYILESSAVTARVSSPYIELIEVISSNNSSDISPEIGIVRPSGTMMICRAHTCLVSLSLYFSAYHDPKGEV